jgi:RNA polymerase sigma-70 factor (ECF subfamily)
LQATMHITQAGMAAIASSKQQQPGLEKVFLQHKDLVFRAAYRVTGNATDAEDVLQTVFLRLARQTTLPDIGNLPGYLHRSAVNASLDILRSRKESRTLSLDDENNSVEPASHGDAQVAAEVRDWLRHALARLNPRWAEMFVLRFVEELTNRDVARMMNTSPAVVAVILHRTRTQLKKDFKSLARGRQ